MRRWLVVPLWASLGLVVYACDDNPANHSSNDAGADSPAPTGTMTTPIPDAGLPDNYIAAQDSGPQAGPVTALVTTETGAPSAGTDVYFTDLDGTVTKVVTGADGKATHTMYPGGSLTANYAQVTMVGMGPPTTAYFLTTVAELTPGDTIHISRAGAGVFGAAGQITGTIANAPTLDAGGVNYGLEPLCGGANIVAGPFPQSYTFNIDATCIEIATGKVPILATARSTNDSSVLAYAPLAVANPDGGSAVANVAAGDWLPPTTKQMTFSGALPAVWNNVSAQIFTARNGQLYLQASAAAATGLTQPLSYTTAPAALATTVEARSSVAGTGGAGEVVHATHYQRVLSATSLAENYAKILPRIHDLKMAGTLSAPTVQWQNDAPLPADGFATFALTGTHLPDGGLSSSVAWQIVFPIHASTTSFNVPALPAALLAQVGPSSPWFGNQITLGASAQAPYVLAHQYPAVLASPEQFAPLVPANLTFDLKTTGICANCD